MYRDEPITAWIYIALFTREVLLIHLFAILILSFMNDPFIYFEDSHQKGVTYWNLCAAKYILSLND